MVELGSLRLIDENVVTDTVKLYVGYSKDIIGATGGTEHTTIPTNSYNELLNAFLRLYDKTTERNVPIRRLGISFVDVREIQGQQLSLFLDQEKLDKENKIALTINSIKNELGKNTILRGINLEKSATTKTRNKLIGGHNAE